MNIQLKPGTYVVAVSGGVDSIVLLNMLSKKHGLKLIVAHYDHGIRKDSEKDRLLVQKAAAKYDVPFVFDEGHLGPKASEAKARSARYKFLMKVKTASKAEAIITAHHQDDVIETAIINMLRGTNRRGLSALKDRPDIRRPLLNTSKQEIIEYARKHNLKWREDSTNSDTTYLRNYVRLKIVPKMSKVERKQLLMQVNNLKLLNEEIDEILEKQLKDKSDLDRQWFLSLSHDVAREVMATWLRKRGITEIDSKRLEILVRAAKTFQSGKQIGINKHYFLVVSKNKLALLSRER